MKIFDELIRLIEEKNVSKVKRYCTEPPSIGQKGQLFESGKLDQALIEDREDLPLHEGLNEGYKRLILALKNSHNAEIISAVLASDRIEQGAFLLSLFTTQEDSVIQFFYKEFGLNEKINTSFLNQWLWYLVRINRIDRVKFLANFFTLPTELLFRAAGVKNTVCITTLLSLGMSPNVIGSTKEKDEKITTSALCVAIRKHAVDIVRLLLKAGASTKNLEYKESNLIVCHTPLPLEVAVEENVIEIVRLLITAFHELVDALKLCLKHNKFDLLKQLIEENGAYQNLQLRRTLLKDAILSGNATAIEYLLQDNPDLAQFEEWGKEDILYSGPLLYQLLRTKTLDNSQKYQIAGRFLALGAYINVQVSDGNQGTRPLVHACAQYGDHRILKLLKEYHLKFDTLSDIGRTVLHEAFRGRNVSAIEYLLSIGLPPYITKHGESELSAALFAGADQKEGNLHETLLLALSLRPDINRLFPINLSSFGGVPSHDEMCTALISLIGNFPTDHFAIRVFLEVGANPKAESSMSTKPMRILLDSKKPNSLPHSNMEFQIRLLHIAGLLVDYGAEIPLIEGTDTRNWPDIEKYISALKAQRNKCYGVAISILSPPKDKALINYKIREYCYIWSRLGILHRLAGDYEKSFECFQNARDPSKCKPLENLDAPGACFIPVDNELVELFYSWDEAFEKLGTKISDNDAYYKLFEVIQTLSFDELTPNNHYKLAELYMKASGLSFADRHDLLLRHFARVVCGDKKDLAALYLTNLRSPENKFKYELDRLITSTEITPETKRQFLIDALSKTSDHLKGVGIKFILGHELSRAENLYHVARSFRHTNVTLLMASVDKLLSTQNHKEAIHSLEQAKELPLFNMLKKDYLIKKKTKAVSKIEKKLAEIKSFSPSK